MGTEEYRCLRCGHRIRVLKFEDELSSLRRCKKCHSSRVIPAARYERLLRDILTANPGPYIDALIGIYKESGITGRFLETLLITMRLVKEAEELRAREKMRKEMPEVTQT